MKLPALHAAAQSGTFAALDQLLSGGADANARAGGGETPLMLVAARGRLDAIGLLVERGADVNAVSDAGNTALMLAAARGQVDAVRALIERGARKDHRNKFGLGAEDWAKWSDRQPELLALLGA